MKDSYHRELWRKTMMSKYDFCIECGDAKGSDIWPLCRKCAEKWSKIFKGGKHMIELTPKEDVVNKPKHYNRDGAMQCIDEMILVFGKETVLSFCLCNAWKYRYRAADKNGAEDLAKSDWYLNKYKELLEDRPF